MVVNSKEPQLQPHLQERVGAVLLEVVQTLQNLGSTLDNTTSTAILQASVANAQTDIAYLSGRLLNVITDTTIEPQSLNQLLNGPSANAPPRPNSVPPMDAYPRPQRGARESAGFRAMKDLTSSSRVAAQLSQGFPTVAEFTAQAATWSKKRLEGAQPAAEKVREYKVVKPAHPTYDRVKWEDKQHTLDEPPRISGDDLQQGVLRLIESGRVHRLSDVTPALLSNAMGQPPLAASQANLHHPDHRLDRTTVADDSTLKSGVGNIRLDLVTRVGAAMPLANTLPAQTRKTLRAKEPIEEEDGTQQDVSDAGSDMSLGSIADLSVGSGESSVLLDMTGLPDMPKSSSPPGPVRRVAGQPSARPRAEEGEVEEGRDYRDLMDQFGTFQFAVVMGTIRKSPEYESFRRLNADRDGAIGQLIFALERHCAIYDIPFGLLDGARILETVRDHPQLSTIQQDVLMRCFADPGAIYEAMAAPGALFRGIRATHYAAVTIQAAARMALTRRRYRNELRGIHARLTLQTVARVFLARCKIRSLRRARQQAVTEQCAAHRAQFARTFYTKSLSKEPIYLVYVSDATMGGASWSDAVNPAVLLELANPRVQLIYITTPRVTDGHVESSPYLDSTSLVYRYASRTLCLAMGLDAAQTNPLSRALFVEPEPAVCSVLARVCPAASTLTALMASSDRYLQRITKYYAKGDPFAFLRTGRRTTAHTLLPSVSARLYLPVLGPMPSDYLRAAQKAPRDVFVSIKGHAVPFLGGFDAIMPRQLPAMLIHLVTNGALKAINKFIVRVKDGQFRQAIIVDRYEVMEVIEEASTEVNEELIALEADGSQPPTKAEIGKLKGKRALAHIDSMLGSPSFLRVVSRDRSATFDSVVSSMAIHGGYVEALDPTDIRVAVVMSVSPAGDIKVLTAVDRVMSSEVTPAGIVYPSRCSRFVVEKCQEHAAAVTKHLLRGAPDLVGFVTVEFAVNAARCEDESDDVEDGLATPHVNARPPVIMWATGFSFGQNHIVDSWKFFAGLTGCSHGAGGDPRPNDDGRTFSFCASVYAQHSDLILVKPVTFFNKMQNERVVLSTSTAKTQPKPRGANSRRPGAKPLPDAPEAPLVQNTAFSLVRVSNETFGDGQFMPVSIQPHPRVAVDPVAVATSAAISQVVKVLKTATMAIKEAGGGKKGCETNYGEIIEAIERYGANSD